MAEWHIDQVRLQAGAVQAAACTAQLVVREGPVPIEEAPQPDRADAGPANELEQLRVVLDDRGREAEVKRAPGRAAPSVRGQSGQGQPGRQGVLEPASSGPEAWLHTGSQKP